MTKIFIIFLINIFFIEIAQSQTDSLKQIDVAEVEVHGTYDANRNIVPMQKLSGRQLKNLGTHSVADAIRYFSGVQIKDYGGIGGLKTVNIRSLGSHHVGVFCDGIEIGNAQNGVVDLGKFSLDNVEQVSVYNGQRYKILQTAKDYASASAIYLSTRTPVFSKKNYHINLGMKAGSFDTYNPSFLWEQSVTPKLSFSVNAEFLNTSGKYKFRYAKKNGYDTTEIRKNGDVQALRIETAWFSKISGGNWQGKIYFYDSERGYPGAAVRELPGTFRNQDRQWDDNFFAQTTFRKLVGNRFSTLINAKYAYDYLRYLSDPSLDASTMFVDNRFRQNEFYCSWANAYSATEWLDFSLSADYQLNNLRANLVDFVYPIRQSTFIAGALALHTERINLQTSLLYTLIADRTEVNRQSLDEYSPAIVASIYPFDSRNLALRAFAKRVFRMPTFNDLYYTFVGNKNLNPEFANQINIGFTYTKGLKLSVWKQMQLQADFYYNEVTDKIIAMPTSNQFRWTMINLGRVEIRGIEASCQNNFVFDALKLSSRLVYTYQKAQDFSNPQSPYYGGQIPYVPWHSLSAIVNFEYHDWQLNYSFIYTGERYESVANIPENHSQPWCTNDISLVRNFKIRDIEYRLMCEVNNLFNQQYEVVRCYPMPGINFRIKLNVII